MPLDPNIMLLKILLCVVVFLGLVLWAIISDVGGWDAS